MERSSINSGNSRLAAKEVTERPWLRRASIWRPDAPPEVCSLGGAAQTGAFAWVELTCGAEMSQKVFTSLSLICPELTHEMLSDLLTPDEAPAGVSFGEGDVRLASTFSVEAIRIEEKQVRGRAEGAGVISFQPVEILAGPSWL